MKKYSISPLMIIIMAAFILIDGSLLSVYAVGFSLAHELAHIICLKTVGGRVLKLNGNGFGLSLKTYSLSYKQELFVALSGPLLSLTLFLAFLPFCMHSATLLFCAFSNLFIFLLNILPIYPLDGGRAVFCMLSCKCDPTKAIKTTRLISFIFLLPLLAVSVIILVKTGYNLSLLVICIYLCVLVIGVKNIW